VLGPDRTVSAEPEVCTVPDAEADAAPAVRPTAVSAATAVAAAKASSRFVRMTPPEVCD
jgi:hypothetical protein